MKYLSILLNCLHSFLVNRLGEFCFSSEIVLCLIICFILITKQLILCGYCENLHTDKLAGLKGLNMLSRLKSLDIDSIHFIIAIVYQMHCIPEKKVV